MQVPVRGCERPMDQEIDSLGDRYVGLVRPLTKFLRVRPVSKTIGLVREPLIIYDVPYENDCSLMVVT